MKLLRLLLTALCAAAGLVVFTQVPASACSCAGGGTAQYVEWADVVFTGELTDREQTNPGGDGVIGSGDPVFYTFDVDRTFKGDPGDAVVESVRDGATCGLEGMRVGQSYVVFAGENKRGGLDASLCGGTTRETPRVVGEVEDALAGPTEQPAPTQSPTTPAVPTQVPSGLDRVDDRVVDGAVPAWAWFGGGVLLALVGGGLAVRARLVRT